MFLVGDLVECQLENTHKAELPFLSNRLFLKSVVDLTASTDIDLQEKVFLEHHLCCGLLFYTCPCIVGSDAAVISEFYFILFYLNFRASLKNISLSEW